MTDENEGNKAIIGKLNGNEYTCDQLYDFLDDCSLQYQSCKDSGRNLYTEGKGENAKEIRKTALQGLVNYISSNGFEGNYKERLSSLLKLTPDLKEAKGYHAMSCVYNSANLEEALKKCLDIKHLSLRAYGKYKTKALCVDPLVNTINFMLKNKKENKRYNPKLLYDFVVLSNELENLKNAGINKENRQLRIRGKPIEDRMLYLLALSYARKGLGDVEKSLLNEENVLLMDDKSFSKDFFSNHGIKNYELLKEFVRKKSETLVYPKKLKGILAKCDKRVEEAKKKFSEQACEKQDKIYNNALALAKKSNLDYTKVLEDFQNFSINYSQVLEEDQESFDEALQRVKDTYDNNGEGRKNVK